MNLELDFDKSVEENASLYFEQAKKAKKKLLGLEKAVEETKNKIARQSKKRSEDKPVLVKKKRQEWFQAFRWFFSSDGFLVLGGRSAKSNEQLVKKHLSKEDFFLHADIQGGSGCIVKAGEKEVPEKTLKEAAQFAGVFSKAWKQLLPAVDVYAVKAHQVSKRAPSGTSLGTGSFMISGKRRYFKRTMLQLAVGIAKGNETRVISGPPTAIKKNALFFVELRQGPGIASDAAKKILAFFQSKSKKPLALGLDEIILMIPGEKIGVKLN